MCYFKIYYHNSYYNMSLWLLFEYCLEFLLSKNKNQIWTGQKWQKKILQKQKSIKKTTWASFKEPPNVIVPRTFRMFATTAHVCIYSTIKNKTILLLIVCKFYQSLCYICVIKNCVFKEQIGIQHQKKWSLIFERWKNVRQELLGRRVWSLTLTKKKKLITPSTIAWGVLTITVTINCSSSLWKLMMHPPCKLVHLSLLYIWKVTFLL